MDGSKFKSGEHYISYMAPPPIYPRYDGSPYPYVKNPPRRPPTDRSGERRAVQKNMGYGVSRRRFVAACVRACVCVGRKGISAGCSTT